MPKEGAQIIFPKSGRGLGHVTLQLLACDRTYILKTIWASDFKFGKRLWLAIAIWLSGSVYYGLLWGSTVGYPSDSLASCWNTV